MMAPQQTTHASRGAIIFWSDCVEAENIFESKKDWTDYVRNGRLVNDARQIILENLV